jgi:phage-related protein (TIGR01555 family)
MAKGALARTVRTDVATRVDAVPSRPGFFARLGLRLDGFFNPFTGLGTERDKRTHGRWRGRYLLWEEISELYRYNDVAARIVDAPVDEMLRRGFSVTFENDAELTKNVAEWLVRLQLQEKLQSAFRWAREYGGGALFLGANDRASATRGLRVPLDLNDVRGLWFLTDYSARELVPLVYRDDPFNTEYGTPATYRVQPMFGFQTGQAGRDMDALREVHSSRFIRIEGVKVERRWAQSQFGWGDSVLQRVHEVIRDYGSSWEGVAALMQDISQGVFKMKGLAEAMGSGAGDVVLERLAMIDMSRSMVRAAVIDADSEEFDRKATPLTGIPDVLDRMMQRLSQASNTPVSVLIGKQPSGLGANNDNDLRGWYASIAVDQEKVAKPAIRRVVEVLLRAKDGPTGGRDPGGWEIEFPPLWQPTELEQADIRLKNAQADTEDIANNVLRPDEVRKSRYGGAKYSSVIHLEEGPGDAIAGAGGGGGPLEIGHLPLRRVPAAAQRLRPRRSDRPRDRSRPRWAARRIRSSMPRRWRRWSAPRFGPTLPTDRRACASGSGVPRPSRRTWSSPEARAQRVSTSRSPSSAGSTTKSLWTWKRRAPR